MIQESMGHTVDREMEHLAASDRMVILTRRVMLDAAKEYRATGELPAVVDQPELAKDARGGDIVVPYGTDWLEGYEEKMAEIKGYRHQADRGRMSEGATMDPTPRLRRIRSTGSGTGMALTLTEQKPARRCGVDRGQDGCGDDPPDRAGLGQWRAAAAIHRRLCTST